MIEKITYCYWEGDPAILVHYADGRIYGFWRSEVHGWKQEHEADIATKAAVMSEADFKKMWPELKLPDFPI
jgi:hypothetical protein